jgi:glucose dehydrogenase
MTVYAVRCNRKLHHECTGAGHGGNRQNAYNGRMENTRLPVRSDQLARRALVGFILTFIAARSVVFLIMSKRMPNLYFFFGGTHVHHLNYGILLLAAVSGYLLFRTPTPRNSSIAAVVYGMAMALTFDEFGMWLHLGGSYWQRASVDAIVVVAALLALIAFARSIRTYESRHVKAFAALVVAVVIFTVVLYDASVRIGRLEGPRLRDLELASSP